MVPDSQEWAQGFTPFFFSGFLFISLLLNSFIFIFSVFPSQVFTSWEMWAHLSRWNSSPSRGCVKTSPALSLRRSITSQTTGCVTSFISFVIFFNFRSIRYKCSAKTGISLMSITVLCEESGAVLSAGVLWQCALPSAGPSFHLHAAGLDLSAERAWHFNYYIIIHLTYFWFLFYFILCCPLIFTETQRQVAGHQPEDISKVSTKYFCILAERSMYSDVFSQFMFEEKPAERQWRLKTFERRRHFVHCCITECDGRSMNCFCLWQWWRGGGSGVSGESSDGGAGGGASGPCGHQGLAGTHQ